MFDQLMTKCLGVIVYKILDIIQIWVEMFRLECLSFTETQNYDEWD